MADIADITRYQKPREEYMLVPAPTQQATCPGNRKEFGHKWYSV